MLPSDPNSGGLLEIARALGELRAEVVFVGGAIVGALLTDAAAARPRHTDDVDTIVEVGSYVEFQTRLRPHLVSRGFRESADEGDPICRWKLGGKKVDVMTTREVEHGPTNRWYPSAFEHATKLRLAQGIEIRVIDSPHFLATKLEAFRSPQRAHHDDVLASHDLEDVLIVVDGRRELASELRRAPHAVREFVAGEVERLLAMPRFVQALPGIVQDEARAPVLRKRLKELVDTRSA